MSHIKMRKYNRGKPTLEVEQYPQNSLEAYRAFVQKSKYNIDDDNWAKYIESVFYKGFTTKDAQNLVFWFETIENKKLITDIVYYLRKNKPYFNPFTDRTGLFLFPTNLKKRLLTVVRDTYDTLEELSTLDHKEVQEGNLNGVILVEDPGKLGIRFLFRQGYDFVVIANDDPKLFASTISIKPEAIALKTEIRSMNNGKAYMPLDENTVSMYLQ